MATITLRPYLAIFGARFLMMLQYRAAAAAGVVTQFWFGAIMVMALAAFYASGRGAPPITLAQAITYTWLGQAFLGLLPWTVDPEIAAMMRSGDIAYERLRPIDTYSYWFARAMAWRTAATLLRAVPLVVVTAAAFPLSGLSDWSLRAPESLDALALFVLSMAAVTLLSAAITTLVNISVASMLTDQGINAITNPLIVILSGMIVPLPLFPDWAQGLLLVQPFAGLVDIPYRIYFGHLSGFAAFGAIALQIGWTVVLIGVGRVLMARTMSRIHVQGG
jgi:ABC-2 type transport system permease protein